MRSQLPPGLRLPASVADARHAGVSRSRLAGTDLRAPFWGVRAVPVPAGEKLESSVVRRAEEYASRMRPGEHFCLVTASALWGAPLPASAFHTFGSEGERVERPLDVAVTLPARAPRGAGVRGRSTLARMSSVVIEPASGLRVTDPASTWTMMGERMGAGDLVVLGDFFVREPMRPGDPVALCTTDELAAALSAGRRKGAARLRAALPLVRTRSRSSQESRLRLLMLERGLPEPELNWALEEGGRVLALIDLAYPDRRVAIEYEGEHHLTDPEQWARDIRRYEMLAARGWRVIRVTKTDLTTGRAQLVARIRAALG